RHARRARRNLLPRSGKRQPSSSCPWSGSNGIRTSLPNPKRPARRAGADDDACPTPDSTNAKSMQAPQRSPSLSRWRSRPGFRHGAILAGALLLCGCATGDFGRVRPDWVYDDIHDWVGRDAVASVGLPASVYPLTDDERALRDLAFPLIDPPYNRNR